MENNSENFTRELLAALSGDTGLQGLVSIGFKMLGNPILITDKSWKAIAMTAEVDIPDDSDWNALRAQGMLPTDAVVSGIRDNLADRIERSDAPFIWKSPEMAYPRLFKRLVINDKTAATISVIEYLKPFSTGDAELLNILGEAVSAELRKNQFQQYSRGMMYEDFIRNLLEGRLTDPKTIDERVKLLDLGIKKNIYVFVFDMREYDMRQLSVSYTRDLLENMISGGKALVHDSSIVLIASFSRVQDFFKTELKNLGIFLKKYNIRCGISRRCTQLSELRFYYRQALDAMRVGTHMDHGRYIYPYGEYAVYHMAEACACAGGIRTYCHPALETLLAHDREYRTCFTASLYTYLRHFRNISEAANALHLHRNTMVYHLKRIGEIMDISLDNYDTLQQIEFSFRLLEYGKIIERVVKPEEIPESDH